jgi:hypothetical protein
MDKVLSALPAVAEQYRSQITKGLQGNPTEAGRARVAVRKLLCDEIKLLPAKGGAPLQLGFASSLVELVVASRCRAQWSRQHLTSDTCIWSVGA